MQEKTFIRHINILLFVIMYALRSYTDAVYESNGIHGGLIVNLKYVVLGMGIVFGYLQIRGKKNLIFIREGKKTSLIIISFAVISLFMCAIHLDSPTSLGQFTTEMIKLILPIIYAVIVLNAFSFEDIYTSMVFVLFFSVFGYLLEIGMGNFTIANIKQIDFRTSYSPFESHYAAGASIAMCTFFMYYRKNKILQWISFLFAIATFKRVAVLFAIFIFVMPVIMDVNREVSKRTIRFLKSAFLVVTLLYFYVLNTGNEAVSIRLTGSDLHTFTMGRVHYITYLSNSNFKSTGLGSTTAFIGTSIEMDLIKIFLELSIVGLILFIWLMWDCAGRKRYTILYMSFIFINLLTSHSLTNSFSWILMYVIIGTINYKQESELSYLLRHRKKNKYKASAENKSVKTESKDDDLISSGYKEQSDYL